MTEIPLEKTRQPKYSTANEVCEYFRISRSTFQLWKRKGLIAGKKIGGKLFYVIEELELNMEKA